MQRRAIDDLTRLVARQAGRGRDPGRDAARLRDAAPADAGRRRHSRRASRTAARSGAGRGVGAPQQALDGFLRAPASRRSSNARCATPAGANSISRSIDAARAAPAAEVLPELLHAAIAGLPWPKSMRWGGVDCAGCGRCSRSSACSTARCCRCALGEVPVGAHDARPPLPGARATITVDDFADYRRQARAAPRRARPGPSGAT